MKRSHSLLSKLTLVAAAISAGFVAPTAYAETATDSSGYTFDGERFFPVENSTTLPATAQSDESAEAEAPISVLSIVEEQLNYGHLNFGGGRCAVTGSGGSGYSALKVDEFEEPSVNEAVATQNVYYSTPALNTANANVAQAGAAGDAITLDSGAEDTPVAASYATRTTTASTQNAAPLTRSGTESTTPVLVAQPAMLASTSGGAIALAAADENSLVWEGTEAEHSWSTSTFGSVEANTAGQSVTFDNTAACKRVEISEVVSADSLLVSSGEYTFEGAGTISTGTLTVAAGASATFNNTVSATDLTQISGVTTTDADGNKSHNITLTKVDIASGKELEISGALIDTRQISNQKIFGVMHVVGDLAVSGNGGNRLDIASGGAMRLADGANVSYTGSAIWGQGALIVEENARASFTSDNDYHLSYNVRGGSITLCSGSRLDLDVKSVRSYYDGIISLEEGSTLNVDSAKNVVITSPISGSGNLIKAGTGTLTLSGNSSTYSGQVTINDGVLKLDGGSNVLGEQDQNGTSDRYIVIENGGTLDINGKTKSGNNCYKVKLSGGLLTNTGAHVGTNDRQITGILLEEDSFIGGSGNFALLASEYKQTTLNLAGHKLTKQGGNTFYLRTTKFSGTGTLDVQEGIIEAIELQNTDSVISLSVAKGASLRIDGGTLSTSNISGDGIIELKSGRLTFCNAESMTWSGSLIVKGDATLFSNRSGDNTIRKLNSVSVDAGKMLTLDEATWNTIWNISSLNGEGNVRWLSDTTHWFSSRIVLVGEGTLSGTFYYVRDNAVQNRPYQSYLELKHDKALQYACLEMDGVNNSYAALAVNTSNAQLAGLVGNEYSIIYSGAAVEGNGANNGTNPIATAPSSTSSNTLTLDIAEGKEYTYSGTVAGSAEHALSLVKKGDGTQYFTGESTFDSVSVDAGKLVLGGTITLGDTIQNAGTVEFGSDAALNLANLVYTVSIDETTSKVLHTYDVVSGGTINNFNTESMTVLGYLVESGRGVSSVTLDESGSVIVTTASLELTWKGTDGTWNTTDAEWDNNLTAESDTAVFYNGDSVVFDNTATSKIVTLDENFVVGNATIKSGEYTLQGAHTLSGNVLAIEQGATLKIDDGLELNFKDIRVSGKIEDHLDANSSWEKVSFVTANAELYLHDTEPGNGADGSWGLYIGEAAVDASATITSQWGENVCIGKLTGTQALTINNPGVSGSYTINNLTGYTGTLTLGGNGNSNTAFTVKLSGSFGEGAQLVINDGAKATLSGENVSIANITKKGSKEFIISGTNVSIGTLSSAGTGTITFRDGVKAEINRIGFVTGQNISSNVTIESGASVTATTLYSSWGFGTIKVDGLLKVTEDATMSSGDADTFNGTGKLVIENFVAQNAGTYNVNTKKVEITTASVSDSHSQTKFAGEFLTIGSVTHNSGRLTFAGTTTNITTLAAKNGVTTVFEAGTATVSGLISGVGTIQVDNVANFVINSSNTMTVANKISGAGIIRASASNPIYLTNNGSDFSGTLIVESSSVYLGPNNDTDPGSLATLGNANVIVESEFWTHLGGVATDGGGSLIARTSMQNSNNFYLKNGAILGNKDGHISLTGDVHIGVSNGDLSAPTYNENAKVYYKQYWQKTVEFSGNLYGAGTLILEAPSKEANAFYRITSDNRGENAFAGTYKLTNDDRTDRKTELWLSNANAAAKAKINLAGAKTHLKLDVGGDIVIAGLDGVAGSTVSSSHSNVSRTLKITSDGDHSYAGTVNGLVSLTKSGTGTLTLFGSNTYSGGTKIEAGILEVSGSGTLGFGQVTISGGSGKLAIGEGVTLTNAVTILVDATNIGDAIITGSGTLTLDNNKITILKDQAALSLAADTAYKYQIVEQSSTMDDGWTTDDFKLEGWGSWFVQSYENGLLTIAIPEPATFGLLSGLGVLFLVGGRRRKRK